MSFGEPFGHQRNRKSSKLNETEARAKEEGSLPRPQEVAGSCCHTDSLAHDSHPGATLAPSIIDSMGARFNLAYMSLISTFINPNQQSPRMIHVVSLSCLIMQKFAPLPALTFYCHGSTSLGSILITLILNLLM